MYFILVVIREINKFFIFFSIFFVNSLFKLRSSVQCHLVLDVEAKYGEKLFKLNVLFHVMCRMTQHLPTAKSMCRQSSVSPAISIFGSETINGFNRSSKVYAERLNHRKTVRTTMLLRCIK
jgi:hypothetical protein